MAMSYLVYPGAVHSRLHHALGAYHLMHNAIYELRNKGIAITNEEEQAAFDHSVNAVTTLVADMERLGF